MPVRIMSDAELTKFEILRDVDHDRMPPRAAAQLLGLSERQVWRLLKAVFGPATHSASTPGCNSAGVRKISLSITCG